jgi:hypothetical protein
MPGGVDSGCGDDQAVYGAVRSSRSRRHGCRRASIRVETASESAFTVDVPGQDAGGADPTGRVASLCQSAPLLIQTAVVRVPSVTASRRET